MRLATAIVAGFLLLAGCAHPPESSAPATSASPSSSASPSYGLTVRVSAETPDGAPLRAAEVVAYVLGQGDVPGKSLPASTDSQGFARFTFREPVRLALRASLPGWTTEGTTAAVADEVVAGPGIVASGRDVFLPLYRAELRLAGGLTVSTATVAADAMGGLEEPMATVDLVLPDLARTAYLARLSSAQVRLAWTESATQRADLSTGLAWNGRLWVEGAPSGPGLAPGDRQAAYAGELPAEGRPADLAAAVLQAAAVTNTAVLGDVALAFEATLRFSGQAPPGLPATCHAATLDCPSLPPV